MVEYIPGEQNIGAAGRVMRYAAAVLSGVAFLYLLTLGPGLLRQPLGVIAAVVLLSSMFLAFYQAETRFCGTLGLLGLYQPSATEVVRVEDDADRHDDRLEALHELGIAVVLALTVTGWVYTLSVLS